MKAPATPPTIGIPAFLQLGDNAGTIFNTAEIRTISRRRVDITEDNREYYKGFITPEGQVHIIRVELKGEVSSREIKCASEEIWEAAFTEFSKALNSYIINPKID